MTARPSGVLYIAGQPIRVDAPIANMYDTGWDATREVCIAVPSQGTPPCVGGVPYGTLPLGPYTKRYSTRPALRSYYAKGKQPTLDAVKAVIKQFVVHHDGCNTADMCFNVLQNERGLSVHFLIDNDGTIYQTIDLALMAYHAADWNLASIGVELCNKGDAILYPHTYESGKYGPKRDARPCKINGHTFLAFEYTARQMESFAQLSRALIQLLPNLPAEYPQSSPGVQAWDTMPRNASFSFSGYIGHYHLTGQKWDPGPFDFKKFCESLRGQKCFPIFAKQDAKREQSAKPLVPSTPDDLKAQVDELYKLNELRADGGFFPVGPWGEARLWHGGIHLPAQRGAPVFAPFPGRLIAARMGKPSATIGSVNFVLLRHDMTLGAAKVQFYSLYMHLANPLAGDAPPEWMTKKDGGWAQRGKPDVTVLLDEAVEAGTLLGHVGEAGPEGLSKPQLHLEFFSTEELFTDQQPWTLIDGTGGGRFCDSPEITDAIDSNKDKILSHQELVDYYAGGSTTQTRYMVTLHVSEWTAEPSWGDALRVPKDFKALKPAQIDQLVADQITPGLWWDARVAAHCRLPIDGVVYHYHPISFVGWFNQQLLDAAANSVAPAASYENARGTPSGITDDFGDKAGTTMRSSADTSEDPCNKRITLQELVQGFDAPECEP